MSKCDSFHCDMAMQLFSKWNLFSVLKLRNFKIFCICPIMSVFNDLQFASTRIILLKFIGLPSGYFSVKSRIYLLVLFLYTDGRNGQQGTRTSFQKEV